MSFEMANSDNPEEIILATQRSLVDSMREVLNGLQKDQKIKQPGLTWEQIDYFLLSYRDKVPTIIHQDQPL